MTMEGLYRIVGTLQRNTTGRSIMSSESWTSRMVLYSTPRHRQDRNRVVDRRWVPGRGRDTYSTYSYYDTVHVRYGTATASYCTGCTGLSRVGDEGLGLG
jgi:hypothetical protein